MNSNPKSDVKDLSLTREGLEHIEWAGRDMPVLTLIRETVREGEAAGRNPCIRLLARDVGDGQPGHSPPGGRR